MSNWFNNLKVFKDKTFYAIMNPFDFQSVERYYEDDEYYASIGNLLKLPANLIIDNIYLGSAFNSADYNWLKENKIDIIVNVTPSISSYYPDDFTYHRIEVKDLNDQSIQPHLEEFYQLVKENPDKKIFVHCFAGRSRSASLVLYYLIKKHEYTFAGAMNFLKTKRPSININTSFTDDIVDILDIDY